VNHGLSKLDFYDLSSDNSCTDQYSKFDYAKVHGDLERAWRLCVNSLVFCCVTLLITLIEVLFGFCCIQPFVTDPKQIVENLKLLFKEEAKQFFLIGYYKFN
jgi:hypothetical protein